MIVPYTLQTIMEASNRIRAGEVVAVPTETVYGLAADAANDEAVKEIYRLKKRPPFNPLIVHVGKIEWIEKFATITETAKILMKKFWPGPLTIILPLLEDSTLAPTVTAGLKTVAVRFPSNPVFQAFVELGRRPVAAPSANLSTSLSCTKADDVERIFKDLYILEDPTSCRCGLESTIVDCSGEPPLILRPGSISNESILEVLPETQVLKKAKKIKAPGQMKRHYAPLKPLRINAKSRSKGEAYLNFGPSRPMESLNLSETCDLEEAARNLFKMLHELDANPDCEAIAVAPIPNEGLGVGINDRLKRATMPKDNQ